MTLCTQVLVKGKIEPTVVFQKARELIGSTTETKARIHFSENGPWHMGNEIAQGLPALLDVTFVPGEPLRTAEQALAHDEWCDADCNGAHHEPACWLEVSFDTSYGYRSSDGEGCGHLHTRLVAELGLWLDSLGLAWIWQNEFTGEWHVGYDRLTDLIGGGEAATEWFDNLVLPAFGRLKGVQP